MTESTEPSGTAKPSDQASTATWQKALFTIALLPIAAMLLPSLIILVLGMMPTVVAAAVERVRGRHLAVTVGMLNFCGCLPFLVELWSFGQSFQALVPVMKDVYGWLIAYSAAGFGWVIYLMVPPFVAVYYAVVTEAQIRTLKNSQRKLVEIWGEEIAEDPNSAPESQESS